MQLTEDKCTFIVTDLMKTSHSSKHIPPIKLKSYALDRARSLPIDFYQALPQRDTESYKHVYQAVCMLYNSI